MKNLPIIRTLTGKNAVGKMIYSVIDVLPIPNIHEVFKRVQKEKPDLSLPQMGVETFKRLDPLRTIAGGVVAYLLVTGKISAEQVFEFLNYFRELVK